jgi:hypothetical protein
VVVASNTGVAVSSDAGATFPIFLPLSGFLPFGDQGDPSATVGASGKICVSYLGLPNGKPPVASASVARGLLPGLLFEGVACESLGCETTVIKGDQG